MREGEKEREIETRGGKSRFNVFIGDAFKTKSPSRADLKTFLLPKIFFHLVSASTRTEAGSRKNFDEIFISRVEKIIITLRTQLPLKIVLTEFVEKKLFSRLS